MRRRTTFAALGALAAGAGYAGLHVPAPNPAPPSQASASLGTLDLPLDLPLPVRRWIEAASGGSTLPHVETAVAWGTGRVRVPRAGAAGVWLPVAWRLHLVPGEAFVRAVDVTWYGRSVHRAHDTFQDGRGRRRHATRVETGDGVDRALVTLLWAWTVLLTPGAVMTPPHGRWEKVDEDTARLHPGHRNASPLTLRFDPATGLLDRVETQRHDPRLGETRPWTLRLENGRRLHTPFPCPGTVTAHDAGDAYARIGVSGCVTNVDVLDRMVASGRKRGTA